MKYRVFDRYGDRVSTHFTPDVAMQTAKAYSRTIAHYITAHQDGTPERLFAVYLGGKKCSVQPTSSPKGGFQFKGGTIWIGDVVE